jgi:single-strand DNA-binding protein
VFDTNIVIVGNVLTAPEWRRITTNNTLVANFRIASTSRRLDRASGRWVDGNSLRVRVTCWRKLAEGVASSVTVGDPVMVVGRLYTRDWTDSENNPRTSFEMEAFAVGHDLARGRGKFFRTRPTLGTSEAEGPEAEALVRGQASELVPTNEVPTSYGEGIPDEEEPTFLDAPADLPGFDPAAAMAELEALTEAALTEEGPDGPEEPAPVPDDASSLTEGSPGEAGELEIEVEPLGAEPNRRSRPRRPAKRQPVSA